MCLQQFDYFLVVILRASCYRFSCVTKESKVRLFSLEKVFRNSETVRLSVFLFAVVCWDLMIENSFKRCFLISLRPLSSVPK